MTPSPHQGHAREAAPFGLRRNSTAQLLVALILLFVFMPFFESLPGGDFIEACCLTLVLVTAMFAVGGRRRTLILGTLLLVPALVSRWLTHLFPETVPPYFFLGFGLAVMIFAVANLLGFIVRAPRVDSEVLCAGVSVYLLLGLLWTLAYVLVGRISPEAFSFNAAAASGRTLERFDAFYFSFTTLSTAGFGDITPVSKLARMLAIMEAVVGVLYVAMLIARLVAMYSPTGRKEPPDHP